MWRLLLAVVLSSVVSGCEDTKHKAEAQRLKAKVTQLEAELEASKGSLRETRASLDVTGRELNEAKVKISELSNTPANRLAAARRLEGTDKEKALAAYEQLMSDLPGSSEAKTASRLAAAIRKRERIRLEAEAKAERARLAALKAGWKGLRVGKKARLSDGLSTTLRRLRIGRRWAFDRHGHQYYERTADRGMTHVVADIDITSNSKDPLLPWVAIYYVANGGGLAIRGVMEPQFYRWSDYGSYLGNYHDNRNDFAKHSTVRFTYGFAVSEAEAKSGLVLLTGTTGCGTRKYERFANPPVSYDMRECTPPASVALDDVGTAVHVVALHNRRRL